MPAETDIVNVALRLVGAQPITSLDDGSESGNVASDIYTELRDDLLASHEWNFATRRVKLAQSSTAPTYEFDHAYALPSDWIRTVSVADNDDGYGNIDYREEEVDNQGVIVSSADDIYMTYIYRVTDPNRMSSDFRRVLQLALARDLAIPLAESLSMNEKYERSARRALGRAKSKDALGSFPESRPRGSWVNARGRQWPRVAVEGE